MTTKRVTGKFITTPPGGGPEPAPPLPDPIPPTPPGGGPEPAPPLPDDATVAKLLATAPVEVVAIAGIRNGMSARAQFDAIMKATEKR